MGQPSRQGIALFSVRTEFWRSAALAAIIAVARLFALQMEEMDGPHVFNAFDWRNQVLLDDDAPHVDPDQNLGTIWAVGLGSVGTAVLYSLTLITRRLSATLFDMDFVKIHNLDRSPIFGASDAERARKKVDAAEAYLRSVDVQNVTSERLALDESTIWSSRQAGTPDIVVSAANERNVRYIIEQSAPPLQIYGTTGANWEPSVIRHIPIVDACSCCLFPPGAPQTVITCATETTVRESTRERVVASLPFLSFGAGLMAAAEVLKAGMPGYPFSPNRTTLHSSGSHTAVRVARNSATASVSLCSTQCFCSQTDDRRNTI